VSKWDCCLRTLSRCSTTTEDLVSINKESKQEEHLRDVSLRTSCGRSLTGFPGPSSLEIVDSLCNQVEFTGESRDSCPCTASSAGLTTRFQEGWPELRKSELHQPTTIHVNCMIREPEEDKHDSTSSDRCPASVLKFRELSGMVEVDGVPGCCVMVGYPGVTFQAAWPISDNEEELDGKIDDEEDERYEDQLHQLSSRHAGVVASESSAVALAIVVEAREYLNCGMLVKSMMVG
jgi:hypothetical protein